MVYITLKPPQQPFSTSIHLILNIWHWHLGHPSPSHLRSIAALKNDVSFSSQHLCYTCPLAKHSSPSFPLGSTNTTFPFE